MTKIFQMFVEGCDVRDKVLPQEAPWWRRCGDAASFLVALGPESCGTKES